MLAQLKAEQEQLITDLFATATAYEKARKKGRKISLRATSKRIIAELKSHQKHGI